MERIKAIETTYKGMKFRSRLEFKWAKFFEEMNIDYVYEPEGFEYNGIRYLPDFYLPNVYVRYKENPNVNYKDGDKGIFVEVKGVLDDKSLFKIENFPYPIIILGDIPETFQDACDIGCSCDGEDFFSFLYLDDDAYGGFFIKMENEVYILGYDHIKREWKFVEETDKALKVVRGIRAEDYDEK